jgi:hypothetical protein
MTIVLRSTKGTSLLDAEVDGNFNDLTNRIEGWNDLVQDVVVRSGTANAPSVNPYRDGLYAYAFDAATTNECFANFHFGHDYIPGSMVYPHVHWSPNTTATGVVRWGVEYTWARRHDSTGQTAFPATQTLCIETEIVGDHQYQHMVNESPDGSGIPGSTMEVDAIIMCRFFRDAGHINDTFPDPVFLLSVDIHYQSLVKTTPLRFPPFN